jgi:hypothetical protein
LTLAEFDKVGLSREECDQLDANGDGVVTERELLDRFFPFNEEDQM